MAHTHTSALRRLRLTGWFEGTSLLLLILIAVPVKYVFNEPCFVKVLGPVHGVLFLLFIFQAISSGIEQQWKFGQTTWKVLLACLIPFGTFYINVALLKPKTQTL